ncbi:hypothetical protein [cf. Phormidesmis sp. LEGE 11477]|uniref:hypothetical protein n=1 Tax=cf. Phormidesmis sp. LEGE 11477 TaxID=1828680 RepID=UPI0018801B6B|nr:hypothetical protein [cf. Phormidesmis sp. LEGE 11477]MBE9064054.1 hypothetical protein [cf. Phormidesmis sp. LEGE 11477]
MPNPRPTQSHAFKQKQFQRAALDDSCIPPDVPLAKRTIGIKLPVNLDAAVRNMGAQKGAWLREVIARAALEQGIVNKID